MITTTMTRASPQRILELIAVLVLTFAFMNFGPSVLLDQHRIDLKTFDTIVNNIAFLLPIYFVLRFNRLGVATGAISLWLLLWLEGHVLFVYDKEREGALLDSIWILFGWIFCYVYSAFIYLLKFGALKLLDLITQRKTL
jgi:hypothetical protein